MWLWNSSFSKKQCTCSILSNFNVLQSSIGTNSKALTTPFVVQHVAIIKLISPIKGGTCIEIIPLLVQIFFVPIDIIIAITELVDNNDKFVKEQVELVDP
jgi:hypothetical protein